MFPFGTGTGVRLLPDERRRRRLSSPEMTLRVGKLIVNTYEAVITYTLPPVIESQSKAYSTGD